MRTARISSSIVLVLLTVSSVTATRARATDAPTVSAHGRTLRASDVGEDAAPGSYSGVATAAGRSDVLVVWNQTGVSRSRDDGRTFQPLFSAGTVRAVAVTDAGEVLAVWQRSAEVPFALVSSARGATTDPPIDAHHLYVAGRHVVVVGVRRGAASDRPDALARSSDGGRTWSVLDMYAWGNFANEIRLGRDGTLRHLSSSEAACGGGSQGLYRLPPNEREWQTDPWPFDAPVSMQIGVGGWTYALDDRCGDDDLSTERLCGSHGDRVVRMSAPVGMHAWQTWSVATNGRTTLATLEGRLLRLEGGAAHALSAHVPAGFAISSVDGRGRAVGVLNGRVVRWSPRRGWRVLAE